MTNSGSKVTSYLIQNARIWSPQDQGIQDVLIVGDRIIALEPRLQAVSLPNLIIVDGKGLNLVPGFIDCHTHLTGGGGEGGFSTRIAPATPQDFTSLGICSVVGLLGTDGITRNLVDLYAKVMEFRESGMSAWMYSGCYRVPGPTLTGSIQQDIVLIDSVIGVGEVAVGDHRSSQPTLAELTRTIADARVGGMISGKAGVTHVHLGDDPRGLDLLEGILMNNPIPGHHLFPTHVNRHKVLLDGAVSLAKRGASLDMTSGFVDNETEMSTPTCLGELLARGVPTNQITMSSDSFGSLPIFDLSGKLIGLEAAKPRTLIQDMTQMIRSGFDFGLVLSLVTQNPARLLKLSNLGTLEPGALAHLVLCDQEFNLEKVWVSGMLK